MRELKVGQVCPSPVEECSYPSEVEGPSSAKSHTDFLDEVFQLSFFAHATRQASFQEIHHDAAIQTTPVMTDVQYVSNSPNSSYVRSVRDTISCLRGLQGSDVFCTFAYVLA